MMPSCPPYRNAEKYGLQLLELPPKLEDVGKNRCELFEKWYLERFNLNVVLSEPAHAAIKAAIRSAYLQGVEDGITELSPTS
jgi:hypothetical protein